MLIRFDRGYTDSAAVYGPNIAWALQDYQDLSEYFPETLLGYNVLLATPSTLENLRGRAVSKVILVGDVEYSDEAYATLNIALMRADFPHVEKWNLNPGRGPVGRIG